MAEWTPSNQSKNENFVNPSNVTEHRHMPQMQHPAPPVAPPGMPPLNPPCSISNPNFPHEHRNETYNPNANNAPSLNQQFPPQDMRQNSAQNMSDRRSEAPVCEKHTANAHNVAAQDSAVARIQGSDSAPLLRGYVEFIPWRNGTLVTSRISGLYLDDNPTGFFAIHIHEGAQCGSSISDDSFERAGAHFNPAGVPHPMHSGDLPPLMASKQGDAFSRVYTDRFTPSEVVGRTVIIHGSTDDLHSQPSGNAGRRIGCGEIRVN